MRQVLLNLMTNAIKYGNQGGHIWVRCELQDNKVVVSVRDDGPGIPASDHQRIFEPFYRSASTSTESQDAGIGLSISAGLVAVMGGELGVDSVPGEGTNFWFRLPASEPREAVSAERQMTSQALNSLKQAAHLLYVEDNPVNQVLMEEVVSSMLGCKLLTVASAEEALVACRDQPPDLILMDLLLPGMSGKEAIGVLRNQVATATIPIIAVSANAVEEEIAAVRDAGADAYVTKPFDIENLSMTIRELLER